MLGLNRTVNIYQSSRGISDSGSVADENLTLVASNIRAAIQANVLNNLPPPPDRRGTGGIFYRREFRCWIAIASLPTGVLPQNTWVIENTETSERFRVRAVVDDAGRSHHYLLRMENYDSSAG